jgi:hypothetical protein
MSYINQIVSLLQVADFVGEHEYIEIAKGKYQLHTGVVANYKQAIREFKIQRQKRNGRKKNY